MANAKVSRFQPRSIVTGCSQRPKPCRMPIDRVTIAAPHTSTWTIDKGRCAGAPAIADVLVVSPALRIVLGNLWGRRDHCCSPRCRPSAQGRDLESDAMATPPKASYGEASIRVLKGLEPVKQRPGMYTRTESPLHVVQEVIDNAADEALAGHASAIDVTLHADGSVSVDDDGRGIPFGLHPEDKVSVIEIVFTRLHAGGKFEKGGNAAYSFSGGLHGVGVSVTNALAKRFEVTTWREGRVATIAFSGGDVIEPLALRKANAGEKKSGTRVRVW